MRSRRRPARRSRRKTETKQPAAITKFAEPVKPASVKTASFFDPPAPAATPSPATFEAEEDDEPFFEIEEDEPVAETEELDDAA